MNKCLVFLLVLALVGMAGCTQRADSPSEAPEPLTASSSVGSEHASESTPPPEDSSEESGPSQSDASNQSESSQDTQLATFAIAGNNGQATKVTIQVPASWSYDADKLIDGERVVAMFEIVLKFDANSVDASTFLKGMDEDNADAVAVGDPNIQGLDARYYHLQTENADGTKDNQFRYWVCIGDKAASIMFYPVFGVGIETQRKDFETFLATLEMK